MIDRSDFPHKIKVMHHVQIPLKDGVVLSATVWLPEDADKNPVPAILEYLPYRKRDGTTDRDALNHPYFAVTGKDGSFTIKDVPPGKYKVVALHRKGAPTGVEKEIEVKADGATADFVVEVK